MEFISEYKYAEVKVFTLEELEKNLIKTQEKRKQLEESIKEYDMWIKAYKNEINCRLINTTPVKPKCIGCEEGYLNQLGHYGGCIPDPMDIELQSIIDSQN